MHEYKIINYIQGIQLEREHCQYRWLENPVSQILIMKIIVNGGYA